MIIKKNQYITYSQAITLKYYTVVTKTCFRTTFKNSQIFLSQRTLVKIVDSGETTRQAMGRLEPTFSSCVLRTAKQDAFGLKIEHKVGLF